MLEIELFLHLSICKQKTILTVNWIVGNRTVYIYKSIFGINNLRWLISHKTKPNQISELLHFQPNIVRLSPVMKQNHHYARKANAFLIFFMLIKREMYLKEVIENWQKVHFNYRESKICIQLQFIYYAQTEFEPFILKSDCIFRTN